METPQIKFAVLRDSSASSWAGSLTALGCGSAIFVGCALIVVITLAESSWTWSSPQTVWSSIGGVALVAALIGLVTWRAQGADRGSSATGFALLDDDSLRAGEFRIELTHSEAGWEAELLELANVRRLPQEPPAVLALHVLGNGELRRITLSTENGVAQSLDTRGAGVSTWIVLSGNATQVDEGSPIPCLERIADLQTRFSLPFRGQLELHPAQLAVDGFLPMSMALGAIGVAVNAMKTRDALETLQQDTEVGHLAPLLSKAADLEWDFVLHEHPEAV